MFVVVELTTQLDFDFRRAKVEFLITELRLGLTFASLALETQNRSIRLRNQSNARRAYEVVVSHVKDILPGSEEANNIRTGLNRLRAELDRFDEADLD